MPLRMTVLRIFIGELTRDDALGSCADHELHLIPKISSARDRRLCYHMADRRQGGAHMHSCASMHNVFNVTHPFCSKREEAHPVDSCISLLFRGISSLGLVLAGDPAQNTCVLEIFV